MMMMMMVMEMGDVGRFSFDHYHYQQIFQFFSPGFYTDHDCSNPLYIDYSHKRGKYVI